MIYTMNKSIIYKCLLLILIFISIQYKYFLPLDLMGNNNYFIEDDLFYYMEIARNFWINYSFTFDEISLTNGFHPLWQYILIFEYKLFDILGLESYFIYGVIGLNIILFLISMILFFNILNKKLSLEYSFIFTYLTYLFSMVFLINGMETILLLLLFQIYFLYFLSISKDDNSSLIVNGIIIILITFSRLDAIVISLLILIVNYVYFGKKYFIKLSCIYFLILFLFLSYNYIIFETIFPISGKVKQFWATLMKYNLDDNLLNLAKLYKNYLKLAFSEVLTKYGLYYITIIGIFLFVLKNIYYRAYRVNLKDLNTKYLIFYLIVLCYLISQLLYYSIYSAHIWRWYLGIGIVLSIFTILFGLFYSKTIEKSIIRKFLPLIILPFLFIDLYVTENKIRDITDKETFGKVAFRVVDWININTKKDDIIGIWAAGQIGFYSDRKVVNLEGLVAGKELLMANKNNSLYEYIKHNNIKYIIQWFPIISFDKEKSMVKEHSHPLINLRLKVLYENSDKFIYRDEIVIRDSLKSYRVYIFEVI